MCCLAATCFPVVFVSLIAIEDLEAVIAQGWALAKCQGHSMAFALLAVDRVETRCLEGFKMMDDGFQSYAKPWIGLEMFLGKVLERTWNAIEGWCEVYFLNHFH